MKLSELNRQLARQYLEGDNSVLEKLYLANHSYVAGLAWKVCKKFQCAHMHEDLVSVGMVSLLEKVGEYRPDREAELHTYLYPHLVGAMFREVEAQLGCMSFSKRRFHTVRKVKAMQRSGKTLPQISNELGVAESTVQELLTCGIYYSSLDDLLEENEDGAAMQIPAADFPVEAQALQRLYLELIEDQFQTFSFRDRKILGGFFGVFGYRKRTLAEIGGDITLKENTVLKRKEKALKRLVNLCRKNGLWYMASIPCAVQKVLCALALFRNDGGRGGAVDMWENTWTDNPENS